MVRQPMDTSAEDPIADAAPAGRPTLKTIAFMTGLGVTTVSRALKDAPEIGPETRKRVQLLARQIGYRPNRAGVRLRTGKTNVISLVLDTRETVGGFVSDIVYGVSEHLASTPYHLIITPYSRDKDPMDPVRYIVETGSADGIIISRTEPQDARVRYMEDRGFPFATHGRTLGGRPHPFHDFDNAAFARLAVQRLAERGRRRLALLAPYAGLSYGHHTRRGFVEAVAEAGLTQAAFDTADADASIDEVRTATAALLADDNPPDGIVSSTGSACFALVAGIEEAGLTLGREIDIVSKQSFRLLPLFRPAIHVVNEDFRLAGRQLARSVIGAIEGAPMEGLQSMEVPFEVRGPNSSRRDGPAFRG